MQAALPFFIADGAQSQGQQFLFGNGPDPCRQTSCTFNAGIRNDAHRTGRLYFIQICKHRWLPVLGKALLFFLLGCWLGFCRFI